MTLENMDVRTIRRYTKPRLTQISITQVLLELIERAEKDEQLATHLKESIHQADPEYSED
jgi:hypothetical protein